MTINLLLLILLTSLATGPLQNTAQKRDSGKTETSGGLHTTTFETPHGRIKVHLPDDLAAGDTISGTVIAEPTGSTEQQRQENSGDLQGYVVEVENQKSPAQVSAIKWNVPTTLAGRLARVTLHDTKGKKVSATSVPVLAAAMPSTDGFRLPQVGQVGRTVQAQGPFDGDFSNTRASIGGQAARVFAESPRKLIAESPVNVVGATEIEVNEKDVSTKGEFRNVKISLTAHRTSLLKGETTQMQIEVSGLQDLKEPINLQVENRSTDVVSVEGGETQVITITPGEVQAGGQFLTTRTLTGVRAGAYVISTSIPASGPVFQPAPGALQPPPEPKRKPGAGKLEGDSERKDTVEGLPNVEIIVQRKVRGANDVITQEVKDFNGVRLEERIERKLNDKGEWEYIRAVYTETRTESDQQVKTTSVIRYSPFGLSVTRTTGQGRTAKTEKWQRRTGDGKWFKVDDKDNPIVDNEGKPLPPLTEEEVKQIVPQIPRWFLNLELPKK